VSHGDHDEKLPADDDSAGGHQDEKRPVTPETAVISPGDHHDEKLPATPAAAGSRSVNDGAIALTIGR
jgi:hypothetical protein